MCKSSILYKPRRPLRGYLPRLLSGRSSALRKLSILSPPPRSLPVSISVFPHLPDAASVLFVAFLFSVLHFPALHSSELRFVAPSSLFVHLCSSHGNIFNLVFVFLFFLHMVLHAYSSSTVVQVSAMTSTLDMGALEPRMSCSVLQRCSDF